MPATRLRLDEKGSAFFCVQGSGASEITIGLRKRTEPPSETGVANLKSVEFRLIQLQTRRLLLWLLFVGNRSVKSIAYSGK